MKFLQRAMPVLGAGLFLLTVRVSAEPVEARQGGSASAASAAASPASTQNAVVMAPGEIQSAPLREEVQRVAVGDPEIADVSIVSSKEILVQAKRPGVTNLIVWHKGGNRMDLTINVVDPAPLAASREIGKLLAMSEDYANVKIELQKDKVFLMGEVPHEAALQSLEQIIASYPSAVVNLVTVHGRKPFHDIEPLVTLAVQVLEVSSGDLNELGVNWNQSIAFTEETMDAASFRDTLLRVGQSVSRERLVATINALVQKNKARLLSEPKLVTASGKEASSFIGFEVPTLKATQVGTDTGSVSASIEYRKTGMVLKMTPNVLLDRHNKRVIQTVLDAEVSSIDTTVGLSVPVGSETILVPGFRVRRANTEVTTSSGETIVIAGLLEAEDTDSVEQVPGLGNIPVLGRLFRKPTIESDQRELLITVTPSIADTPEQREAAYAQAYDQAKEAHESLVPTTEDPHLRYALQIQRKIADAVVYPIEEQRKGMTGALRLRLRLLANGTLDKIELLESSGSEPLDYAAVMAASSQSPYPAFPTSFTEKDLWLDVPVVFHP